MRKWTADPSRWLTALAAAVIAAAVGAVYRPALAAPFVFDDAPGIKGNASIRQLWPLSRVLFPPSGEISSTTGRPLVSLSLALNFAAGGLNPRGYHATNIAFHILAALALFGLVRRTVRRIAPDWTDGRGRAFALGAALLWALHPLLTESVTCAIQRTESMMGMFYLVTLYCFVRYAEGGRRWALASVLCCLCGMASKETMVSAPVLVFLFDRTFFAGSFAAAWRLRRRYYSALAATWIALGALILREGGQRGQTAGFGLSISPAHYAMTQVWAVARYLRLAIWPSPLILDYGAFQARWVEILPQAAVLAALIAAVAAALRWPDRWGRGVRVFGFAGAFFFAVLGPSSSVIPLVTQTVAEHRMYLPTASVVMVAAMAAEWLGRGRGGLICAILAAMLAVVTFQRNRTYHSEESIIADSVAKWPLSPRAYNILGALLTQEGRPAEAIAWHEKALQLFPESYYALNDLGTALGKLGRYPEALAALRQAIRLRPDFPIVYNNLGMTLLNSGDVSGAIAAFGTALRLQPDFAVAAYGMGNALKARGDAEGAIASFRRAIALDPKSSAAHNNLALELIHQGRYAEAIAECRLAIVLQPDFAEAHNNLGIAYASRPATLAQAAPQFEEALRLRPGYAEACNNLGNSYWMENRLPEAIASYRRALQLKPDYPEARESLAQATAQAGQSTRR